MKQRYGEFGAAAMLAGVTRMKAETLPVAIFINSIHNYVIYMLCNCRTIL
jgi:ABC-type sulfate transport system, permease component